MKEEILKLRSEGKTYDEIKEIVGCSKGTVSYHCGPGQKEKTNNRLRKRRENLLLSKVDGFRYRKDNGIINLCEDVKVRAKRYMPENTRKFQGIKDGDYDIKDNEFFRWEDVIEREGGEETICYLSGEPINLKENQYQLDHIQPKSRGGDNSLANLGIAHSVVNMMKHNLTPIELLEWCAKILEHNGFDVKEK